MKIVCLYLTAPRNPLKHFTEERKKKHLKEISNIISLEGVPVHCHVVNADYRKHGLKTFRSFIKGLLAEDSILCLEYQGGLTYSQKDTAKCMLYEIKEHHQLYLVRN